MEFNTDEKNRIVFDIGSLYKRLTTLKDKRSRRGIRYPLPLLLLLILLAKLAGEDSAQGIASWLKYRTEKLTKAFGLSKAKMPHRTTISRILGTAIIVEEFEKEIGNFFQKRLSETTSKVITFDGKTLRGTIEEGKNRGLHLLSAYVPAEGVVLYQMKVESKENEISAAPQVLKQIDLQNCVVLGDAMHTQRALSAQIVNEGGDYVWIVKENQRQLREDIAVAFEAAPCAAGFNPGRREFHTAKTIGKGHGRLEQRTITVTNELKDYLDWPGVEQVFKLERRVVHIKQGQVSQETVYGITSLNSERAEAARLLALNREYWGIENGLHYRRDVTFKEDRCQLKNGDAAHMMAALNNLVIGLILRMGYKNVSEARRRFAASSSDALQLILKANF